LIFSIAAVLCTLKYSKNKLLPEYFNYASEKLS
jgi:hypothetical protein